MVIILPGLQKKKINRFLALDIGTEAVKALIFEKQGEKTIILGSSSQYFDSFSVFDGRDFEQEVLKKAVLKVINAAQEIAKIKTNFTFLGLPANVLKARVIFQDFRRENPKNIIDEKEKKEIQETILKGAERGISQVYALEAGILPQDIQFIDLKILEAKIDGYEVPGIQGYDGKNLRFRVLATFSPEYYLENFFKISQDLNLKILKIVHPAQNLTAALLEEDNAIFLDVGGNLTQVFLIRNGKLEIVNEYGIGGETFSRALSEVLGLTKVRARIMKERYSKGLLSTEARKRIQEILFPHIEDWFSGLKSKLKKTKGLIPSSIFLFGDGSLLPGIKEILTEGSWKGLHFTDEPRVKFIYPKDFKNIVDTNHILNSPKDVGPILILYATKNF